MKVKVVNPVIVPTLFDKRYADGSRFVHVRDGGGMFYMGDVAPDQPLENVLWTPTFPIAGLGRRDGT